MMDFGPQYNYGMPGTHKKLPSQEGKTSHCDCQDSIIRHNPQSTTQISTALASILLVSVGMFMELFCSLKFSMI